MAVDKKTPDEAAQAPDEAAQAPDEKPTGKTRPALTEEDRRARREELRRQLVQLGDDPDEAAQAPDEADKGPDPTHLAVLADGSTVETSGGYATHHSTPDGVVPVVGYHPLNK